MKKIIMKKKNDLFIFFVLAFLLILNQKPIKLVNAENLSSEIIKNFIIQDSKEIHILFSKSVENFDLKYENFEKFIEIDPLINLKCGWINSRNVNCQILNPEKIFPEKNYEIKIYDSEIQGSFNEKKPIFQRKIFLKEINFLEAKIEKWENQNSPIIKIVLNDFVETDLILENFNLIQKQNQKSFLLKKVENQNEFLNSKEKKENQELLEKRFDFQKLSEKEKKNIETKFQRILFLKPISILEENLEFDLFFKRKIENEFQRKKILSFKTFEKDPKFLGIRCNNFQHHLIELKFQEEKNLDDQNSKCLGSSSRINLLFSTPFEKNLENLVNQIEFNWPVNKKEIIEENKKYSEKSNPYQISVPIENQDGKKLSISFSSNGSNKLKKIFNSSKESSKKIYDDFENEFNQKFIFHFESANQRPIFHQENFENIFSFQKNLESKIFFNSNNIKNYDLEFDLIQSNLKKENQKITKDLDDFEKNKNHKMEIDLDQIFENQSGILIGKINAQPIENEFYDSIQTKIFAQKTSFEIFTKKFQNKLIINLFEIEKNSYVENAEIFLKEINPEDFFENNFQNSKIIFSGKTDENGIFEIENLDSILKENFQEKIYIIEAKKNSEIAWLFLTHDFEEFFNHSKNQFDSNEFFYKNQKFRNIGFFGFPDSFIHQTNEDLFFKIYLKKIKENFDLHDFKKNFSFDLYLENSNDQRKILIKKNIQFDEKFFMFSEKFFIPSEFNLGEYNFQIKISDLKNEKEFYFVDLFKIQIQNFEQVDFQADFEINKEKIFFDEEFKISAKTKFYSGAEKLNSKIRITSNQREKNFGEYSELNDFIFENFSNFFLKPKETKKENFLFHESIMHNNNEFSKNFKIEQNLFPYGEIEIQATIFDENQKSISKRKKIEYFGSKIFIGIKPENLENSYFSENSKQNFVFFAVDFEKKPIEKFEIYFVIEKQNEKEEWIRIQKKNLKTDENGKAFFNFDFQNSGKYRIAAFAKDNSEKQISSFEFFIQKKDKFENLEKIQKNYDENLKNLNIKEIEIFGLDSKKIFNSDKKIEFQIQNPFLSEPENVKAILFFENSSKQFILRKNLNQKIEKIELPIFEEFLGPINLKIIVFKKDQNGKMIFKTKSEKIFIHDEFENEFNALKISAEKENYKPNEEIKIFVSKENQNKNEKFECSLIAMNEFIFDIQPGEEKIENFRISNQVFSRNLILEDSFYHIFGERKKFFPGLRVFSDLKNENFHEISKIFLDSKLKEKKSIIHFEKSFEIDFLDENEEILSYKAPENFSGNIKNLLICNLPNSNRFFTKTFDIKSFKDLEIQNFENFKNLSPGEKMNFNINILNHQKENQNQNLKIIAKIKQDSFLKKISNFEILDQNEKKEIKQKFTGEISKEFDFQNQKTFSFSIGLKDFDNFLSQENFEIEISLYKKNEKNEEIFVDSKIMNFFVLIPEIKKTIVEQEMIESELIKKINLNPELNGQKSKISISLSKTILNNLENIFMIGEKYDENSFQTLIAKFFTINAYNFFVQKEKFSNFKIFENFEWKNSEKKSFDLFENLKKYQNDQNFFKEFENQEDFKKNIFFAAQKLFVLNFLEKTKQINDQSSQILKEKKNLTKFLLKFINENSDQNQIEINSYVLYVLSFGNEISNLNEIYDYSLKMIKNNYKNLSLQGKIFLLHAFLNLNQKNEKVFEFLKNQIEQIIENYGQKNGLFLNLKSAENNLSILKDEMNFSLNQKNESCLNCSMLSFLTDFNLKFKNSEKDFNFELPFIFAKTIINRDFKINFQNSNQMISCLESFINYWMNFENQLEKQNQNSENDYVNFQILIDSKISSDEKISIPNYVEIENIKQFLGKDLSFKIKNLKNDEFQNEKDFTYVFIKFDLYEKLKFKNLLEKKNLTENKNEEKQIFGLKLKKEYYKYNFEEKNFIKIENLEKADLKKGDILKINLKVFSNERKKFILLEDKIPNFASFVDQKMILNEKFFEKNQILNQNSLNPIINNEKILFYINDLSDNQTNFSYILKIHSSGIFNLFGANVKEINQDEIFAFTDSYKNFFVN